MRAIRPAILVLFALGAAVLAWGANAVVLSRGLYSLRLPLTSLWALGLIAALTVGYGIGVWRSRTGRAQERMDPLVAARVLVLAQACAHSGAVVAGWHLGAMAAVGASAASALAWPLVIVTAAGLALIACGILVEFLCRIPPEEKDLNDASAA